MTRTDIHRPSAINPEDYKFVGCDYYGPNHGDYVFQDRVNIRQHLERTGGSYSDHEHGGSCHVCGAHAHYVAVYHHPETNKYIVTGEDCAAKIDNGEARAFRNVRKHISISRARNIKREKAKEILEKEGLIAAWDLYNNSNREDKYEENTICNIVGNLIQYGSISDKASNFVKVLLSKIENRAEVARIAAEKKLNAKVIPFNRVRATIVGVVISKKQVDTPYGSAIKILVEHADGWKIWGSKPSGLGIERGDKIEFDAKIEISKDDPKFGFFSRPTKARVLVSQVQLLAI